VHYVPDTGRRILIQRKTASVGPAGKRMLAGPDVAANNRGSTGIPGRSDEQGGLF